LCILQLVEALGDSDSKENVCIQTAAMHALQAIAADHFENKSAISSSQIDLVFRFSLQGHFKTSASAALHCIIAGHFPNQRILYDALKARWDSVKIALASESDPAAPLRSLLHATLSTFASRPDANSLLQQLEDWCQAAHSAASLVDDCAIASALQIGGSCFIFAAARTFIRWCLFARRPRAAFPHNTVY
jgi:hypothetical protein